MPTGSRNRKSIDDWQGTPIVRGQSTEVTLAIGESYSGMTVRIPIHVRRAAEDGPVIFVTAALHGDEINGTGAIRQLIQDPDFELLRGTVILVPVLNLLAFDRHSRYLPDRRDLNRSFPGSKQGSLASRLARAFFDQVTRRCDFGIDLHTAALRRTNFPNVRADMSDPRLAAFARAFGAELIVDGKGPKGSLRLAGCKAGCATLILEAGEVWKVEPSVVEYAQRGIVNCLRHLKMVSGKPEAPAYRMETNATKWVRATQGGFLEFHVSPGEVVQEGDPIATNTTLLGDEQNIITAPRSGVILGMTTLPSVAPGDPVCHIAYPRVGVLPKIKRAVRKLDDDSLHERMKDDLARNVMVTDAEA